MPRPSSKLSQRKFSNHSTSHKHLSEELSEVQIFSPNTLNLQMVGGRHGCLPRVVNIAAAARTTSTASAAERCTAARDALGRK